MRSDFFQWTLIFLGLVCAALLSVFFYREMFPEYRIYQKDYIALEEFRSTYTGEPPPQFNQEVKQIVIERDDKGPPVVDRCISCHVALKLPDFSPTKIAYDINGNLELDERGWPKTVPNENYVWAKLQQKIDELTDDKVNEQLKSQGEYSKVSQRLAEADTLKKLKTAKVGDHVYDVTKVLQMHPLIGRETRPFEYHPIEEYGCNSCHSGNGRGLTTEKAHGPVFDGKYHAEFTPNKPQFLEEDLQNDPKFSKVFNAKPGHDLLFQTTPILVGSLMQAKCIQCHQSSQNAIKSAVDAASMVTKQREKQSQEIEKGFEREKDALLSLLELSRSVKELGLEKTLSLLEGRSRDYSLLPAQTEKIDAQLSTLKKMQTQGLTQEQILQELNRQIISILGSPGLTDEIEKERGKAALDQFLQQRLDDPRATGTIFVKLAQVNLENAVRQHIQDTETSFSKTVSDQKTISEMTSDIDYLTQGYHRGENLYLTQGCYACHRISGFARGGIGPELSRAGEGYPWFLKESIVWPQADLKNSTMPNYHLDHEELEDLVTFLLGQRGDSKVKSETGRKVAIQQWEAGKKLPWEKSITPAKMKDLRYAMTVFATEGCAACHRLKGFESNIGFAIEKGKKPSFNALYEEQQWFSRLFPEEVKGSEIVKIIEEHADEIDKRIVTGVREDALLDEIEQKYPKTIEAFYSNFKYALRAKDHLGKNEAWKTRVRHVLMMYIQEYGLGRLVGPRPNWSGIYRSDEWLMEHFRNPSALIARSIMPVFPFDDSKFYALTNMLDELAKKNRNEVHQIWENKGFDPALAVKIHCAQCHGDYLQGHGPVAEWIYPIPKNLRNAQFLRNLTKERVIQSIVHGVKGTPMPPWGEVATDKHSSDGIPVLTQDQARQIVDWLFATLPGARVIRSQEDVPKWQYKPEDAIEELQEEGNLRNLLGFKNSIGENFYVSLKPEVAPTQVTDVFQVVPHPVPGGDKNAYYIKKKFYTPENLWQGKQFFEVNCAVCHGKEGDGAGQRAEFLQEAKPRMLTNLDWLDTRDDLRLLRSIKYGVSGTSMTPWGDLTTSLQRMQLVMYIRTLSAEPQRRSELFNALYKAFNQADRLIEEARVQEYQDVTNVEKQYQAAQDKRQEVYRAAQEGKASPDEAGQAYAQELELLKQLKLFQEKDKQLLKLKEEVKKEREIYQGMGVALIAKMMNEDIFQTYLTIIALNDNRYEIKNGKLEILPPDEKRLKELHAKILNEIENNIDTLRVEKKALEGKIASSTRSQQMNQLQTEINAFMSLKQTIVSGLQQALNSVKAQQEILKHDQV